MSRRILLVVLSIPLLFACRAVRALPDATVHMLTPGPTELGVSTEYGVVFLGRGQQSGLAVCYFPSAV